MNPTTRSRIIHVTLATIWLTACDSPLTGPYPLPSEPASNPHATTSGTEATESFTTSALSQGAGNYQIELIPADAGSEGLMSTLQAAAGRWMQVLRHTELPDMRLARAPSLIASDCAWTTAPAWWTTSPSSCPSEAWTAPVECLP